MLDVKHLSRLGDAMKDLRWSARLTQTEVRDRTGMSAPQLSRYENGHETPSLESLVKYLAAVGADLCDLQRVLVEGVKLDARPAAVEERGLSGLRAEADRRLESSPELRSLVRELMRPNADGLERLERRLAELEEKLERETA